MSAGMARKNMQQKPSVAHVLRQNIVHSALFPRQETPTRIICAKNITASPAPAYSPVHLDATPRPKLTPHAPSGKKRVFSGAFI